MSKTERSSHARTLTGRELCQQQGWSRMLVPKPFDIVSSALYIGVLIANLYSRCACEITWWYVVLLVGAILTLMSIDRLEYWFYGEETHARMAAFLLVTRIILIEFVAQLDNFNFSPFLYLIPPFLAILYFGNRVGYALAALAWLTYLGKLWLRFPDWYKDSVSDNNFIIFTLGLVFVITMARTVLKEKASRVQAEALLGALETSHQQLKAYSAQVAELATTRERNRLARDIHDTLGHYLTVINVQLEKALAFHERSPREANRAVGNAKRLASEALQDVRRSVGTLRATDEVFSFSSAITNLVDRVQSDTLSISVTITGDPADFSKQALMALYRAVQEGLTNVQKHAQAGSVALSIQFTQQEAQLSLSDDGCGFDAAALHSRQPGQDGQYGLQGVQERLELVGGDLQVESHPGAGCRLVVIVPKDLVTDHAPLTSSPFLFAQEEG